MSCDRLEHYYSDADHANSKQQDRRQPNNGFLHEARHHRSSLAIVWDTLSQKSRPGVKSAPLAPECRYIERSSTLSIDETDRRWLLAMPKVLPAAASIEGRPVFVLVPISSTAVSFGYRGNDLAPCCAWSFCRNGGWNRLTRLESWLGGVLLVTWTSALVSPAAIIYHRGSCGLV